MLACVVVACVSSACIGGGVDGVGVAVSSACCVDVGGGGVCMVVKEAGFELASAGGKPPARSRNRMGPCTGCNAATTRSRTEDANEVSGND